MEEASKDSSPAGSNKKQKHFNPGDKLKRKKNENGGLKEVCLKLVHFINRGGSFTYQQIDELIMSMQHSVLNLQKKKREIIEKKRQKAKEK